MKRISLVILILLLGCVFVLYGCNETTPSNNSGGVTEHTHSFLSWNTTTMPSCTAQGMQTRSCSSCGFSEYLQIPALGHTEVIDAAVPASCAGNGKTEGSHCSVCNTVIIAQSDIAASDHTPVIDSAIDPTCTTDGKTEGSHCSVCEATIVAQTTIPATGHQYNDGTIITPATCLKEGTKKYTCTVSTCNHTYNENFTLSALTATEIYNESVKYVGEIVTYDKRGNGLSLGTGFVIFSDGWVLTNYHVIDGAYSADITINGKIYEIVSVLAYDPNIDLAVVKINASGLATATICKNPVEVGSTVYAIGSSRGMTNTYSQGIVTYANRIVDGVSYVQHDASITHGNSGGPLLNVYGEVIGINTWGISDSQNLNFAVFADELDNLIYGKAQSLSELAQKNLTPYEMLADWICNNKTMTYDGYVSYYDNTTDGFQYCLSYNFDGSISVSLLSYNQTIDIWTNFYLYEDDRIGEYYCIISWEENREKINQVFGYIDFSTFTTNTVLRYNDYDDFGSPYSVEEVMTLCDLSVQASVGWLRYMLLSNLGIDLVDLGFTAYR